MTLSLSIANNNNNAIPASPSSDDSTAPRTPGSPGMPESHMPSTAAATGGSGAAKRKPSRRANTAERRATHNAVERQRRETLNGRFLDLAALLPNLSQIRRPSKSSIVNSSIAHIHASRRHRLLAARELRLVKLEADALRRELNEWRDRANIPRVEEPVRGEGFSMVLSGELEVLVVSGAGGMDGEEGDEDEDMSGSYGPPPSFEEEEELMRLGRQGRERAAEREDSTPFAHNPPRPVVAIQQQQPHHHAHPHHPMIASPTTMSFDNPAMAAMYQDSQHVTATYPHQQQTQHNPQPHWMEEKVWLFQQQQQILAQQQQQQQQQRSMGGHSHASTPPGSSSGLSVGVGGLGVDAAAYFHGVQNANARRERSASMSSSQYSGGGGHSPSDRPSPVGVPYDAQWVMKQQQVQQQAQRHPMAGGGGGGGGLANFAMMM